MVLFLSSDFGDISGTSSFICKTAVHFTAVLKWLNLEHFCSLDRNETLLCEIISTKYYQLLNVPVTDGLIQIFTQMQSPRVLNLPMQNDPQDNHACIILSGHKV